MKTREIGITVMSQRLNSATKLVTDSGRCIQIDELIGDGGQGDVYRGRLQNQNEPIVFKLFYQSYATEKTKKRIRHLQALKLYQLDSRICSPLETVTKSGFIGHIATYAEGITLLEALEQAKLRFEEAVEAARQIASLIQKIMSVDVIHGDLQTQNFKIEWRNGRIEVYAIDLDNYRTAGVPPPEMIGMTLYLAPELRNQHNGKQKVILTKESDLYSFGVLVHEVLLHFHPIAGFDQTIEEIDKAMLIGWIYDPKNKKVLDNPHGYPVDTLNPEIINLLRAALSPNPQGRPSIETWVQALHTASQNISSCSICNVPFINDNKRRACPYGHQLQKCVLQLDTGEAIELSGLVTILGRYQLGGSNHISRGHIIVRKIGNSLYLEPIGLNPTCRWHDDKWVMIYPGTMTKLNPNDRLLVANTPLQYTPK